MSDNETIEYYLKELLNKEGYLYDVINAGLWKNFTYVWINRMITTEFNINDIVIVTLPNPILNYLKKDFSLKKYYILMNSFQNNMEYLRAPNIKNCFLDHPGHHNAVLNRIDAARIFKDILPLLQFPSDKYFISWDIFLYYKKRFMTIESVDKEQKIGSIVVNCNPFTKGHRYLIEEACKKVDVLYIFVVEEDASEISFADRLNMVLIGTQDIKKVRVLPSGEYLISKKTFEQYFSKDNVTQVDDMGYDLHIFADVIAKELGITYRFVGEEPFDIVTRKYNEMMKKILPQSKIEVIEIPRKIGEDGQIISASRARKYIDEGNIKKVKVVLPEVIVKYLGY